MGTLFSSVYNRFLNKITDDMYMELTPQDTIRDLQNLLIEAIPGFEFPRKQLDDYSILVRKIEDGVTTNVYGFVAKDLDGNTYEDASFFEVELTSEEVNILAILMMIAWLQRQVTSIENTRMKYSGTDFKMTSQANHLGKLLALLAETQRQSHHMQRLYKRRKTDENGNISSNWSVLREYGTLKKLPNPDENNLETENDQIIFEGGII